ncbi:MAG: N-acetylmuramoyl-L-alanine amidase [Paludibacteraceae bacterium]|nr:N-acetylmuramoyl-L-alanine amidase [Paludibacteraceae bacterium]
MRAIKKIIVHCADTPEGRDDRAADIRRWHKAQGWNDIGYHYVVDLDGTIEPGRPIENAGAHCTGHNADSIGVCYIGGCDKKMQPKDTRTDAQKASLLLLLKYLVAKYPGVTIYGHRDFANKSCPSFDAKKEYEELTTP